MSVRNKLYNHRNFEELIYSAIMLGGHMSCFRTSGSGTKRAEIDLQLTPLDGGAGDRINYQTLKLGLSSDTTDEIRFAEPLVLGEKIFLHPTVTAETNNTRVSVQYAMLLIKDTVDIDSIF